MKISASIVTYHTPLDELKQCIDTLLQCDNVNAVDIVDNSRSETIKAFIESVNSPILNYIPNDNTGYGAANNISIRRTFDRGSELHLVMNSDIVFTPHVIGELADLMAKDETIGLVIPKVLSPDGTEQSSYHPLPTPADLIAHRFIPRRWVRKRMDRYELKVGDSKEPIRVPYVHGCFMLMRINALKEVGLFDERFFMYPEDIDLTRRINEKYKALVIPWLTIVHNHRAESRHNMRMLWIHATNMVRYFNKWGWF